MQTPPTTQPEPTPRPTQNSQDTQSPQDSQSSQISQISQNSQPSPSPRRYTLWELVRHQDDDRPDPSTTDPSSTVLSAIRPSAWPD